MRQANLPLNAKQPLPSVTLLHGDCLEIMPTLPERSVQMVFADLPYRSKNFHSTDCKWDTAVNLRDFWENVFYVSVERAAIALTAAQPFTHHLISSNLAFFRYCLVWNKLRPGNFVQAKRMPMRSHEDIVIFYRELPKYNPQMIKRQKPRVDKASAKQRSLSGGVWRHDKTLTMTYTHRYPPSIIQASTSGDGARGCHPTQKPVALLEWLIRTYTNEGDTVLDPTAGSMTTAIAALRTGRNCICIEKDSEYFRVGSERVAQEKKRLKAL